MNAGKAMKMVTGDYANLLPNEKQKNPFEIALKAENGHVSNAKFRLSLIIALKKQSTKMFEKERVILRTNLIHIWWLHLYSRRSHNKLKVTF